MSDVRASGQSGLVFDTSDQLCHCRHFQLSVRNCFIRGSVVRYLQLPADECDTQLLQDAARKEAQNKKR